MRSTKEIYLTLLSNSNRFDQCDEDVVPYDTFVENTYRSNSSSMDPHTKAAYELYINRKG